MDATGQLRQGGERGRLVFGEGSAGVVAMTRYDDAADEFRHTRGSLRPVERIPITEERDGAVLEQVAGEEDAGVGHVHHDVVVGVAQPEVAQLDAAPADLDVGGLVEGLVGRVDDDLREVGGDLGFLGAMAARRASPVRAMNVTQRSWPQIVAGRKTRLPKAWSKWPWVSTTTVTGAAVNSRRSARISRAWT